VPVLFTFAKKAVGSVKDRERRKVARVEIYRLEVQVTVVEQEST
jgi:hypothetical protein